MSKIAVLITCHNRKNKTLKCLERLFLQNVDTDVFLVDDGSSDGTAEAVEKEYPKVNIIKGNGTLYWNRGMYTAWEHAEKGDYDFYLWLNDDTYIFDGALQMTLDCSASCNDSAIIIGASCDPVDHSVTTFGADVKGRSLYPNGTLQHCDEFGGNFVLVPRSVYHICGKIDPYYHHSLGDTDYGKMAAKKGINVYLAPQHAAECINDFEIPKLPWLDSSRSLRERYKMLFHPLSYSNPKEFFYFYKKHQNIFVALIHVCSIYRNLLNIKAINKYKK